MKCLITGANGFLGEYIQNELKKDNEIFCLSRSHGEYKVELASTVPEFSCRFDLVIHIAGRAHYVGRVKDNDEHDFYLTNVIGTFNLLKGLDNCLRPKMFVYISSVAVYGKTYGLLLNEETSLGAIDPYGKSKIEAEKLILDWCRTNSIRCTILRLPLVVGFNPPGNLGSMIQAIKNGYFFNISGGEATKSMVLADDVAKIIIKAAEVGGTYNLTDGHHPSFKEISNTIAKQFGRKSVLSLPSSIAYLIAIFGDLFGNSFPLNTNKLDKLTKSLTFDDSKAKSAFGWSPKSVLQNFDTIFNQ
jgi:nucleoside-diphosphate-sugar epimerase